MPIYKFYVPWDTDVFLKAIGQLVSNFGSAATIGFWGFVMISAIYLVLKVVDMLLR